MILAPFAPAALARSAEKLDKRAIESFGKRWFEARPKNYFEAWADGARERLLEEAAQMGELPDGSLDAVVEMLFKAAKRYGPKVKGDAIDTPYGEATWIASGKGKGKGLVLGLHGGGEGAGSASEATRWHAKNCVGVYPQGIRLVHDTWNTVHGERFLLSLIELAKVQQEIDPDRVYSMGFSMGGTGSWFMAGRHPDLLAGASPCAGVVMAEPQSQLATKEEVKSVQHGFVPNVRNLAMYYYIGLADRNCMPGTYLYVWDRIEELRQADPGGYVEIEFATYPGLAHAFPPGEPTKGIEWIGQRKRNAFPTKLVWEYATEPFPLPTAADKVTRYQKHDFYWLHCDVPTDAMRVVAVRDGNEFDLTIARADPKSFSVWLRPGTFDPSLDVVVRANGDEVFRGRPRPSFRAVIESFDAKLDRTLVFDRRVEWGSSSRPDR